MFCDPRPEAELGLDFGETWKADKEKDSGNELAGGSGLQFYDGNNNYNSAAAMLRAGTAIKYTTWQQVQVNECSLAIYHAWQTRVEGAVGVV